MDYNLLEMPFKDFTLLLRQRHSEEFVTQGYFLNDKPNKRYLRYYSFKNQATNEDVELEDFIAKRINEIVKEKLDDYLEKNINNQNIFNKVKKIMYARNEGYHFEIPFYSNFSSFRKEIDLKVSSKLSYHNISKGIIKLTSSFEYVDYDILKDEFINFRNNKNEEIKPLEMFYNNRDLKLILASEQLKRGKANPVFEEIIRIKEYIEGKKSLWVKLKNGNKHQMQDNRGLSINDLLYYNEREGKFYLNNSWNYKKRFEDGDKSLEELDCLEYSRSEFRININKLKIDNKKLKV